MSRATAAGEVLDGGAAAGEVLDGGAAAGEVFDRGAAAGEDRPGGTGGALRDSYGYAPEKDALIKRLHRIEGQVRGIERMLCQDRYCIDIITQISAVTTALDAVAFKILDDHVNHCVAGALASGEEQVAAQKSRELLEAVHRFARGR